MDSMFHVKTFKGYLLTSTSVCDVKGNVSDPFKVILLVMDDDIFVPG